MVMNVIDFKGNTYKAVGKVLYKWNELRGDWEPLKRFHRRLSGICAIGDTFYLAESRVVRSRFYEDLIETEKLRNNN